MWHWPHEHLLGVIILHCDHSCTVSLACCIYTTVCCWYAVLVLCTHYTGVVVYPLLTIVYTSWPWCLQLLSDLFMEVLHFDQGHVEQSSVVIGSGSCVIMCSVLYYGIWHCICNNALLMSVLPLFCFVTVLSVWTLLLWMWVCIVFCV